jgi:hypothetical protein
LKSAPVRDIPTRDSVASLMARLAHSWQRRGMTSTRPSTDSRSTEKHISSIFAKIKLPDLGSDNRRVLAVLTWLKSR